MDIKFVATNILDGIGGFDNILEMECCITRLRFLLKNQDMVNQAVLVETEAAGILYRGEELHIVYGPTAPAIYNELMGKKQSRCDNDTMFVREESPYTDSKELQKAKLVMSPMCGKVIPLAQVNDGVFSEEMLGPGFAMIPEDDKVYSPVDGIVMSVFPTGHALTLQSQDGIELLIHIGLDTVELNGKYYNMSAKPGDKVKRGDLLLSFSVDDIKEAGYSVVSPIVIINASNCWQVNLVHTGKVTQQQTILSIN